jgi:hypothetical protein
LRFSGLILEIFLWCFGAPHAEKRPKTRLKKIRWEKTKGKKLFFSQLFRPKVFDIDFPQKVFYGVFELPLLRNAQKRHKKKQKGTYLPDLLAICQIYPRFIFFLSERPLAARSMFYYSERKK